jgi:signal transduction histidine kinase
LVVLADPDQLAQALINLVRNAAEASLSPDASRLGSDPNGAAFRVPRVEISWKSGHGEALIDVVDNGPGLTNSSNIFVPFYTTKPGGTGIGLVLAQQIAIAHSGSVQLTNRSDSHGCRACLRLPLGVSARNPA